MAKDTDFFISYATPDRPWAEWIADTLEGEGFTTILDAWDFRPGEDFVQRMVRALEQSARTILVLSPAYLVSEFAASEWRPVFAEDPDGERGLLLPVRIATCKPPGLLRSRIFIDLVDVDEPTARQRLLEGVSPSRAKPRTAAGFPRSPTWSAVAPFPGGEPSQVPPLQAPTPSRRPIRPSGVPGLPRHFVDRPELISQAKVWN